MTATPRDDRATATLGDLAAEMPSHGLEFASREPRQEQARDSLPVLIVTTNEVPGWRITQVYGDGFGLIVRARNAFSNRGAQLRTLAVSAQQAWGPALGQAVVDANSLLQRLIARQAVLLQATVRPGLQSLASGMSLPQRGCAPEQRVWKAQPGGGAAMLGTVPGIWVSAVRPRPSIGTARSRFAV